MKNIEDIYPLTPLQSGMLFHSLMAPESGVYVNQVTCTLPADLDTRLFRQAWETLVKRHAVLRTSFLWDGLKEPLQAVRKQVSLPWQELDWRGLPAEEQQRRSEEQRQSDRHTPLPLSKAPLLRFSLLRLDSGLKLIWTFHHLLLDGWSLPLLLRELVALHAALSEGRQPTSPTFPPVRPFSDYVVWLEKQDQGKAEPFWRRELAGLTAPPSPGILGPRAGAEGAAGNSDNVADAEHEILLSREATAALQAFSARHDLTLQTVTQGAWAVLLARYSGEEEAVFGTVVSGRPATLPGVLNMVGMFVNTLPARVRVNGDEPLVPWLRRLQESQLARQELEHTPLSLIQRWSEVPAGSPLFEALYVFENYPDATDGGTGADRVRIGDLRTYESTHYPLTLVLTAGDRLSVELRSDRSRVDEDAARRLLQHFAVLLTGMAGTAGTPGIAETGLPAADLPLLSAAELHQVRFEWNEPLPQPAISLAESFEGWADRTPDKIAVVAPGAAFTYAELDRRANRLARSLRSRGVTAESRVGLCIERSPAMIVAVLGILKAGAAYVPLDPAYPRERLAFMIEDARLPVLLTEERLLGFLPENAAPVTLCLDADESESARAGDRRLSAEALPESLAYVIYTSGSTGRPKGVMVHRQGLSNAVDAFRRLLGVQPTDRVPQLASLSFDASAAEIGMALSAGATLVLGPRERLLAQDELKALLESCTLAVLPPSLLATLAPKDLPDLKTLIVGGEACPPELARRWSAGKRFWNGYGPTEAAICATAERYTGGERLPIGRPIDWVEAYVLDRRGHPVPAGVPGELCLSGPGLARGYLNRPERTAASFVPHPLATLPGERLYRTGDLCRQSHDGEIEFLGRLDHQVKIRGLRIELGDIEAALLSSPGVRDAVVVVREDPSDRADRSPGDRRLVAYVVGEFSVAELRAALRERLPDYMVPAAFVTLETLPLTPTRKVDRKALPAPEPPGGGEEPLAPRTPVEEILAGIWAELLGLDRVGAGANFFELGGHSLLATRVMSRLRDTLGVELPLSDLFTAPTLADLAARVDARMKELRRSGALASAPPLLPMSPELRTGSLPLSFGQERLWLIDQLEPGSPRYNVAAALRVSGPLDSVVLASTLGEIVRRHEALRTVFARRGGVPVQVIRPAAPFPLPLVDLSGLPEDARETLALALAGEAAALPFDLARGPLLRCLLLRLTERDHAVLLTLHHIAGDGWSVDVLVREVAALYPALSEGTARRPSPLPELPVQYGDFAVWQRSWMSGEVLEQELAWWRRQLAGAPPLLTLPTDRPRPPVQSFRGRSEPFALPAELSQVLRALSRREGATLFMTLLAAWSTLLARYSGQRDLSVGTPIAGRTRREVEELIGFFLNTLVLRLDLSGEPGFGALLGRVRQGVLAAYTHQEVPFEMLVEALKPERSLAYEPLFQVVLNLHNQPRASLSLSGLTWRPVEVPLRTVQFDLILTVREEAGGLACQLDYRTDLFDRSTVRRMAGHLETLLARVTEAPERSVDELPLLTAAERHQLLAEWAETEPATAETAAETEACLHELFAAQARRAPRAPAVILGVLSLTYGELDRRANRLARRLQGLGVGPEVVVGVCLERSLELVVAILGVLKAGGAYLPLDPAYPQERLEYLLADSAAPVVVTRSEIAPALAGSTAVQLHMDGEPEEVSDGPVVSGAGPESLAYVIYTSGSTGRPQRGLDPPRQRGPAAPGDRALVRLRAAGRLDPLPLLCLRLLGLGNVGRVGLRREPDRRAVLGEPLAGVVLRAPGPGGGDGAQPDPLGLPPADAS